MASLHTGSSEIIYIQTNKVSITIKGIASPNSYLDLGIGSYDSESKVFCDDSFDLTIMNEVFSKPMLINDGSFFGIYRTQPLFFEQQRYELVVEAKDEHIVTFWHDNVNLRDTITQVGRKQSIISGVLNFGSDIGYTDLVIKVDGVNYIRVVLEIFPTKINYKEDFQSIVEDVTKEIYNLVFDFLKKTYREYKQSDKIRSSPVEFLAVISRIYSDLLKAIDVIITRPHHVLTSTYEVLPSHKIRQANVKTIRWIERHPDQTVRVNGNIAVANAMSPQKQVTYDVLENRLTKYILLSTIKKLESFKKNYLRLSRKSDAAVSQKIDGMIKGLSSRCNRSFLNNVSAFESSLGLSLVFSMAPGYRDLYKYYLMLMRGLSISGDVFHISIKDLSLLYEYWCFIKLNSLIKDRYELVSQDIVRVHGNGLSISLVKGQDSRVKYKNPVNGEIIMLSYNPRPADIPTISQRPDNVLTLQKTGAKELYEYVFDAKYRINPAIPGTDYYGLISETPGPEVDDINTMHRYRDAIVYQRSVSEFLRVMFGAYVLFPYPNEEEYRQHRFYQSIEKVNIGGLPFLPSAVEIVSGLLDELITDSPESAFERTVLPRGIEDKLAKTDWTVRDVLVGSLSNSKQLEANLEHSFYHIPCSRVRESAFPIRYIALYQSKNFFGTSAGIRYYGEVTKCIPVIRNAITEIPSNSDEQYYRFEIKEWKRLSRAIIPKESGNIRYYTNLFLLTHSSDVPELLLRTEEEYRLYSELKRAMSSMTINDKDSNLGFIYNDSTVLFDDGSIDVYRDKRPVAKYSIEEFSRSPNAVFRRIKNSL